MFLFLSHLILSNWQISVKLKSPFNTSIPTWETNFHPLMSAWWAKWNDRTPLSCNLWSLLLLVLHTYVLFWEEEEKLISLHIKTDRRKTLILEVAILLLFKDRKKSLFIQLNLPMNDECSLEKKNYKTASFFSLSFFFFCVIVSQPLKIWPVSSGNCVTFFLTKFLAQNPSFELNIYCSFFVIACTTRTKI